MSRRFALVLVAALAFATLLPAVAQAQFYPVFHKLTAPDDDVDDALMGFPPSHACPDPCNELHTLCRIINCGSVAGDGSCVGPNPPLTGGFFTDTPPATLPLDCARGVLVTGAGTWDPPVCDVATNTVTVSNINVDSGGTVEISFWSLIDCENGTTSNEAFLEWDQNPNPGMLLRARDPGAAFGLPGLFITVGEPGAVSFTKNAPALQINGMPPMRQGSPGTRTGWVIEGANPLCDEVTLLEMYDTIDPPGCLEVDCASLRLFINDIPTPIPPGTRCPDPMRPAAFTLGGLVLQPQDTFRLEYDAIFTSAMIPECCNLGNFVPDGTPEVQTSDPDLDNPLMPEATCVAFNGMPEPVFNAVKTALDEFGGRIDFIEPGQIIDWAFTLSNNGGADGTIGLTDDFPALAVITPASIITPFPTGTCTIAGQSLDCTGVFIAAGETVEMVVRSTVDCAATGLDEICNAGNVSGPGGSNPTHCPTCPAMAPGNETCVQVQAPAFSQSTKTATDEDGDGVVGVGEVITWRLQALNTGTADGRNVVLTDLVPVDSSYVPGSLTLDGAPLSDAADADAGEVVGGVVTVRFGDLTPVSALGVVTFQTQVDSVASAQICNDSASLQWDSAGSCPLGGTPLPVACVPTTNAPTVSATKSVAPTGAVERGATLTYSVEACNAAGAAAATGVVVSDDIPAGATFVNGSMTLDGGGLTDAADVDAGTYGVGPPARVTVTVDDLAPGECRTVSFEVLVDGDATGSVRNTASVSGDGVPAFDTNEVSSTITVPNPAELSALKSVTPTGSVDEGATLSYSVSACNGPAAAPATGVMIDDDIPAGATYVPGTLALDGAPLTDITDLDAGRYLAGPPARVLFDLGGLAPGECKTATFDVVVDLGATGSILNTASVSSDTVAAFDTNEVESPIGVVNPPRLSIVKSSALLATPPANVGEALEYTLTACNAAAAGPADGVVVTDPIPLDAVTGCGGAYVGDSLRVGGVLQTDAADGDAGRYEPAPGPGQVVVDLGTLAPGECVDITFEVVIEAGCDDAESVDNVATLTATGEPAQDSNTTSDVVVVIDPPLEPIMLRKEGFPLVDRCPNPPVLCGCEVGPRLDPVLDDCLVAGTCAVLDPTSWVVPGELTRSVDLIFYEVNGAGCVAGGDAESLTVEKSGPDDVIVRLVP